MLNRLLGWLLHNANSAPPWYGRKEFYEMKSRLLLRYGTPRYSELQHFQPKECWHCTRPHRWYCDECDEFGKCCRCSGTRIYLPEIWVKLIVYELGKYTFHYPVAKLYELPEGRTAKYEGKIIHDLKPYLLPDECRLWLELAFNTRYFFRRLGTSAHYGRYSLTRPLVTLGTVVALFRFDRWRIARALLPHQVYWWLKYERVREDDSIPF